MIAAGQDAAAACAGPPAASAALPTDARRKLGFWASILGLFAANLGNQVAASGIADLQAAAGLSANEASWIVTAFFAGQFLALPLAATAVTSLGPRRVLIMLSALHVAACLYAMTTDVAAGQIAVRVLQGMAAGAYGAVCFGLAFRTYAPTGDLSPGLMGIAIGTTLPAALGVIGAAWLVQAGGWQVLHMADALLMLAALVAVTAFVDRDCLNLRPWHGLDWTGYALFAPGMTALVIAISQGERYLWTEDARVGWLLIAGMALVTGFVVLELRREHPLVDFRLLAVRDFAAALAMLFVVRLALQHAGTITPRFLTTFGGFRPRELAAVFYAPALLQMLLFPAMPALCRRVRPDRLLIAGIVAVAASALWLSRLTAASGVPQFFWPVLLAGFGPPLVMVPLLMLGTRGVPPDMGPSAGILFNGVIALANAAAQAGMLATLRLREVAWDAALTPASDPSRSVVAVQLDALTAPAADPDRGLATAVQALGGAFRAQANALAFVDAFVLLAALLFAGLLLAALFTPWASKGSEAER